MLHVFNSIIHYVKCYGGDLDCQIPFRSSQNCTYRYNSSPRNDLSLAHYGIDRFLSSGRLRNY
jgi:hypothetical protein